MTVTEITLPEINIPETHEIKVPAIIRGKRIEDVSLQEYQSGKRNFFAANPQEMLSDLILADPAKAMKDIHALTTEEIIDFLVEVGEQLHLESNPYLQEALEYSIKFSNLTRPILTALYSQIHTFFTRKSLYQILKELPAKYLDTWYLEKDSFTGRMVEKRAFGSRVLHVLAGNVPVVTVLSMIRGILTRCDNIYKTPSNDPFTAAAILAAMYNVDPEHPVTLHNTCIYYKGGDLSFEKKLLVPQFLDRIVVWGGMKAVTHVRQFVQPGLSLISFDPKLSISIIGREAFEDPTKTTQAAKSLARDIGSWNQEACLNSRYVYVEAPDFETVKQFGKEVYRAMQDLPKYVSTPTQVLSHDEKMKLDSLSFFEDLYYVVGAGKNNGTTFNEGTIICTQEPIDVFPHKKTAIIMPISMKDAIKKVNASTQTIGVFPDSLKEQIKNDLILAGGQRICTLGEAIDGSLGVPHDGLEAMRQMCKWGVVEHSLT